MSGAPATASGAAPAAAPPARWFHHALSAPPQAVPDNLHGILSGPSRGRLRALALALRRAAGPVLVLASDDAAGAAPPGLSVRDLDFAGDQPAGLIQQPALRRLCERAAGDGGARVAACWSRIREQDRAPGCYRGVTLRPGPGAVAVARVTIALERCRLPAPLAHGGGLLCLVRSLAELRLVAALGWRPAGAGSGDRPADRPGGMGEDEPERVLSRAYAAAGAVHVPTAIAALCTALCAADPVQGPPASARIRTALQGAQPWRAWAEAVTVITATPSDAERTALVLDLALSAAHAQLRSRDAALRTLVIDSDLLGGAVQESALAIARCGRKAHCSCLILESSPEVPGWRDHAGFTIAEEAGRLWLATDQDYQIAIDGVVGDEWLVRAHAVLHRSGQGG